MPAPVGELRRGRIFYALFPFTAAFPLAFRDETGTTGTARTVEAFAAARRGAPTDVIARGRLRPVLLLHDGTRGEHEDVVCLKISGVKPRHRRDARQWDRIERREHPVFFHLPADSARYGLPGESVVRLASLGTVHKSALLGPRHIGELTATELEQISARLTKVLSLDLSRFIAARALELLRRAGLVSRRLGE